MCRPRVRRLCERAKASLRCEEGAFAVEFGFVALPFLLLVCAILTVGFMLICSSTLDAATQKAARQLMVGSVQAANLTAAQFKSSILCASLPSAMFDCSKVVVDLVVITPSPEPTAFVNFVKPDFSGLILPSLNNASASFCVGAGGSYQVLRVVYPMPLYMSIFANSPQVVQGQFVLLSTATFKNEPFQGGASTQAGC